MKRLLLIVFTFIVYGSLYPFRFDFERAVANPLIYLLHAWPTVIDRFLWRDASVNVLLYFPLGLTLVLVLERRWPRAVAAVATVAAGVALSACLEMLQIFDRSRTCSLLDVACNFAGTLGGASAGLTFRQEISGFNRRHKLDRAARGGLMLACCWAGYQLYPFLPLLSQTRVRANVEQFLTTPVSPVDVFAGAADWFALALLLRAAFGRLRTRWLLLAMLCLPLRVLIMERTLSSGELIGAGLALLAWIYPAEGARVRAGAAALAVTILLRELSPFQFTAQAREMSWLPFAATLSGERLAAALVLLRKIFEYGALVWLLRASGLRYVTAGVWVAAALLLLEMAQRHMPAHQPEITDAVMATLLACILWGAERRARP